jgi:flagellar motor switch/type III secretory pathway protein FliN
VTAPTVVPILASGLPRVSATDAARTRRLLPLLAAFPARLEANLAGPGSAPGCIGVSILGPATERLCSGPSLGLTRGAGVGRLTIDGALAQGFVARALGLDVERPVSGGRLGRRERGLVAAPAIVGRLGLEERGLVAASAIVGRLGLEERGLVAAPAIVRRLGLGERGLVAGLVATWLQALRSPLSVSIAPPDDDALRAQRAIAIDLGVEAEGLAGAARLEVPESWLIDAAAAGVAGGLGGLGVEARLERARTFVAAGALAGLAPGDAVVFDGVPSGGGDGGAPWPVRLVLGPHVALAELGSRGELTLRGAFRRATVADGGRVARDAVMREEPMDADREKERAADGESEPRPARDIDRTEVLAAAPLEVVAEVGRLTLRGDEVLGLAPGAVLMLGGARSTLVALRVGGELWAEGELVDVDGELAVRVTKTFNKTTR